MTQKATPTPKNPPRKGQKRKPKLAVWKFSSCDGCQLSLLDCEDELLNVAEAVDIAYFLEATRATLRPPYDVSLVEGSITTAEEIKRIKKIRQQSKILITLGACATSGGIQALKNGRNVEGFISTVYAHPAYIDTLSTSSPIAAHVPVDYELRGCPINKAQLLDVLGRLIHGQIPRLPQASQCIECKLSGTVCVMVSKGQPCLGPVTQQGCGNQCPSFNRGCYGCFGPKRRSNTAALADHFVENGMEKEDVAQVFESFNANAKAFAAEVRRQREGQRK